LAQAKALQEERFDKADTLGLHEHGRGAKSSEAKGLGETPGV
jgi:hypothetical protein